MRAGRVSFPADSRFPSLDPMSPTSSGLTHCPSKVPCSVFRQRSPFSRRGGWRMVTPLNVGQSSLHVRHCPGHTPGHVVFHSAEAKRAFVGDVLFAGSIGRTDFPQGDLDTLLASIRTRLWPMGDETVFIPGHGPESTFGQGTPDQPLRGGHLTDGSPISHRQVTLNAWPENTHYPPNWLPSVPSF